MYEELAKKYKYKFFKKKKETKMNKNDEKIMFLIKVAICRMKTSTKFTLYEHTVIISSVFLHEVFSNTQCQCLHMQTVFNTYSTGFSSIYVCHTQSQRGCLWSPHIMPLDWINQSF